MASRKIELLAPARDLRCGIAAIDHGADSVYIGGPQFGARAAASNSLGDIAKLVRYGHQFKARIYVALNTLFRDDELEQAVGLCHQLASMGVDALIIQDFGLLECDLPPIALHSSTQMNNLSVEKVDFLEKVGFSQVVLARELSLQAIREIRAATNVSLEFFVHGALCVSYSGQCYISEVMAGRSGNRGECAQYCRHKFNLKDREGNFLVKDRYLLSLKDLDLSDYLTELVDAGVDSFKIEGRLKNESYVKNVTAYYRKKLDRILGKSSALSKSSSGHCSFDFDPDPEKSFHRGKTRYCISSNQDGAAEIRTPKSIGKFVGSVSRIGKKFFTLDTGEIIANGDGLCFFDRNNELQGFRVNRVVADQIYPKDGVAHLAVEPGTEIFRNLDQQFFKRLKSSCRCRSVDVSMVLSEVSEGLHLQIIDEDNISSATVEQVKKERARKDGTKELVERQLQKSGETIFSVRAVTVDIDPASYYPTSVINKLRRKALEDHHRVRLKGYQVETSGFQRNNYPWPGEKICYRDNIINSKAVDFYIRHGAKISGPELGQFGVKGADSPALMTAKYCLRAQLSLCPKKQGKGEKTPERLILVDKSGEYEVTFNCLKCEMILREKPHE